MIYSKFIYDAERMVIAQLDNDVWFLEPEWKDILCRNLLSDLSELEDSYIDDWWDIEEILKLEVERRNNRDSTKKEVIDWLYDLITAQVEPAIMQEETDYIKQVVEFMKANRAQNQIEEPNNIVQFPVKKE